MKNIYMLFCLSSLLYACTTMPDREKNLTEKATYLKKVYYDGVSDDLLTAGLGLVGLQSEPPKLSAKPTAAELRKSSYYHQFKALNDLTEAGGFGRLYAVNNSSKSVPGHEYWTQRSIQPGVYHTVVLQIPDDYATDQACLVVAPSSGSRNVFGAVGTSGFWALVQGCAVIYTDKGTGTEIALSENQAYQIDGEVVVQSMTNKLLSIAELKPSTDLHVVQKHPYSQVHPEQYWGEFVLDAAAYGLSLLQAENDISRSQVKVCAASVSNGGGAVLRAAEKDVDRLLDAVVAAEPQVNLKHNYSLIKSNEEKSIQTMTLLELSIMLSLFEPCAALDDSLSTAPFKANTVLIQALLAMRCQALADSGLITGEDLPAQAATALTKVQSLQIEASALQLAQINTLAGMWSAINHTYTNSYLQKTATDNLCQTAMSAFTTMGAPRGLSDDEKLSMFALSNGIAPSNGVELASTDANNQIKTRLILAPNYGLDAQMCFYELSQSSALKAALEKVISAPEKNQLPTIILHGQADGTVAINHSSRAYYHSNQSTSKPNRHMRYYEIEHVQHFDAFLAYPGFQEKFVPMHPYFEQALSMMLAHLRNASELPPSQVISTKPRGAGVALNETHVPAIAMKPGKMINVKDNQLVIQ